MRRQRASITIRSTGQPDAPSQDLAIALRELHAEMDHEVLAAYGWTDIDPTCAFLLDYEIDEETWGRKKKPWRYRWPDAVHDEVLARLLALNHARYAVERAAGKAGKRSKGAPPVGGAKRAPARRTSRGDSGSLSLFDGLDDAEE